MRKIKYIYNYPENREIGKQLSWRDCTRIASKTGYSADFVYRCLKLGISLLQNYEQKVILKRFK